MQAQASTRERQERQSELQRKAARLHEIRNTLTALHEEAAALSTDVKALLAAGYRVTVQGQRPVLRPSVRRSIPFTAFRAQFGDKLTRQCLTIDLKAVDQLVKQGVVGKSEVEAVTIRHEGTPALHWVTTGSGHAPTDR